MNFRQRIDKAIRKKEKSAEQVFTELCFVMSKHLGWGYHDIMEAPTPLVLDLVTEVGLYLERKNKASKNK